ncbi:ParB N-terminal domain-containing protein [Ovoidimarina sediminis]|uniref:ParB N-terminal domain-containing protein n=1 Tax=Ovoidimarina sediminis TaxID=3079856 RepID=UPI00290DC0FA|nr:ParB N-terminal domain-containing protein [Rhodophyticola sp. MJ-SS7]MDU8946606.1 ParB N-terminal domain-containing protein [Rhodophyticola sp. MJ-SS7]
MAALTISHIGALGQAFSVPTNSDGYHNFCPGAATSSRSQNLGDENERMEAVVVTKKESQSAKFPPSRRNDPVPVIEIIYRRTDELKRSPHRVRKVKRKHVRRIQASIERFGFSQPILVRGDEIVDGCTRAAAAENMGLDAIPCIDVSHLSDDDIRLLRITINKLQERGAWDEPALKLELAHQLEFNQDISVAGFEAWEVDAVLEIGAGEDLADETDTSFDTPD